MQTANNKMNINIKNTVQLPFDGMAKGFDEITKMVDETLLKRNTEKVDIVFPVQWAMKPDYILRPECGIIALLTRKSAHKGNYNFTCFAKDGAIGVTATRYR